jgi:hypothetical protein
MQLGNKDKTVLCILEALKPEIDDADLSTLPLPSSPFLPLSILHLIAPDFKHLPHGLITLSLFQTVMAALLSHGASLVIQGSGSSDVRRREADPRVPDN